jgi:formate dehydrogenase major subunit
MSLKLTLDGRVIEAKESELLIDLLIRRGAKVPSVCYHHQLGPIQTSDTCLVEMNGDLVRACATKVANEMTIETKSLRDPCRSKGTRREW